MTGHPHTNVEQLDFIKSIYAENIVRLHHLHRCYEFVYAKAGSALITVDGKKHAICEGEGILLLPFQVHSYAPDSDSSLVLFRFSPAIVSAFANLEGKLYAAEPVFRLSERGKEMVELLLQTEDGVNDKYLIRGALYLLCDEYCRSVEFTDRKPSNKRLLNSILLYVENNFKEDINLDSLSRTVGYDYQYISRYVAKNLGISFSQYLTEYRIHYACRLLSAAQTPISEVAAESGYGTVRNFDRTFLKLTGVTPREYRRKTMQNIG